MTTLSTDDIFAMLDSDPSLREQLLARLGVPKEPHNPSRGPIPPADEITFVCGSLLDNGANRTTQKGRKPTGPRYKLALEIWTQPVHQISRKAGEANPVFNKNIGLRPRKEFVSLLYKNLRSGKITDAFNEFCLDITARCPERLFGVNIDRNDASAGIGEWTWHEQLVVVGIDCVEPVAATIFTGMDGTGFQLDHFEKNEDNPRYTHTAVLDECGYFRARDERRAEIEG